MFNIAYHMINAIDISSKQCLDSISVVASKMFKDDSAFSEKFYSEELIPKGFHCVYLLLGMNNSYITKLIF